MSERSASPYSDRNPHPKKKKIVKGRHEQNERISESGQSKLTNFFKNTSIKPKLDPKPVQKILMTLQAQLQSLKQQEDRIICEKDEMLQEQAQAKLDFQSWMKKSRYLVQDCLSEIYLYKRDQRGEIDIQKGFYDSTFRVFTQGIFGQDCEIRKDNLESQINNQEYEDEEQKEVLAQMLQREEKKLKVYRRQLAEYRQRLFISHQEKSCKFAESWPILSNRYQILELLGKGGFSEVYKAYDLEQNKFLAIKVSQTSGLKTELAHYIVRQYQNHMKLQHPNIAKLHEVIQLSSQSVCIVLQFCDGPQLSTYIKQNGTIEEKKAGKIMKQILLALNYLSSLNPKIIHYDLKPQNIMFNQGKVKILDFGLSKQIDNEHSRIALSNQGIGTYWYLPPETFREKNPQISEKVDIWSAGVIFYEMLFGRKPFGHNKSQNTIYHEGTILEANQIDFPDGIEISQSAKSLIRHCLAYEPNQRYTPAEALSHRFFK